MTEKTPALSLPNLLTIARIVAIPVIVALAILNDDLFRWIALILFIAAAITDYFDGVLARKMNLISPLGRMLDPIADKLLVGALIVAFAWDRTFSAIDLVPAITILMREIFVSGLREFLGGKDVTLHVSPLAKYKTTVQLVAIGLLLAEPLLPGIGIVSDTALWIAAILTLVTGWSYWQSAMPHMTGEQK